jgi:hypothetical protein
MDASCGLDTCPHSTPAISATMGHDDFASHRLETVLSPALTTQTLTPSKAALPEMFPPERRRVMRHRLPLSPIPGGRHFPIELEARGRHSERRAKPKSASASFLPTLNAFNRTVLSILRFTRFTGDLRRQTQS